MKNEADTEKFDIDGACDRSYEILKECITQAYDNTRSSRPWASIDISVRGHPIKLFNDLINYNNAFVMRPVQREETRLEIMALGKELVELGLLSQIAFESICKTENPSVKAE